MLSDTVEFVVLVLVLVAVSVLQEPHCLKWLFCLIIRGSWGHSGYLGAWGTVGAPGVLRLLGYQGY